MESNRIYLRALELDDYKTSIQWRKDDEIWDMVGGAKYFVSSEYEKKWVADTIFSKDKIVLAICLKEDDKYIGNVILESIDWINRSASSAILIGEKKYWGQGYASEAYMQMLNFAFMDRGLNRIFAYVLKSNIGSLKMHEKCGYKQEGVLRDSVYKKGEFHDQILLAVIKADFGTIYRSYMDKHKL